MHKLLEVFKHQLEDVKKYNIIPSFFISHIYYFGDIHIKNLGIKRAEHISPAGSSLKQDILFTFHQDTLSQSSNMFEKIWCAVNNNKRQVSAWSKMKISCIRSYQSGYNKFCIPSMERKI